MFNFNLSKNKGMQDRLKNLKLGLKNMPQSSKLFQYESINEKGDFIQMTISDLIAMRKKGHIDSLNFSILMSCDVGGSTYLDDLMITIERIK